MTTIHLYGEAAQRFGALHRYAVESVGEAIRAIEANYGGFIAYLEDCSKDGVDFNVKVNDVDQDEDGLKISSKRIGRIDISPVVRGSKSATARIVIAIVLIVIAAAGSGGAGGALSGTAFGIEGAASYASIIGMMGVSLLIGGVASLIAGNPKSPTNGIISNDDASQSYLFNGPENTTTQGGPVPICYGGPILVGSQVISAGIFSEEVDDVVTPAPENPDDSINSSPFNNGIPVLLYISQPADTRNCQYRFWVINREGTQTKRRPGQNGNEGHFGTGDRREPPRNKHKLEASMPDRRAKIVLRTGPFGPLLARQALKL